MKKSRRPFFPQQTTFDPLDNTEWGFKYPEEFFDPREKLWELEERAEVTFKEYEKDLNKLLEAAPDLFDAANSLGRLYEDFDQDRKAAQIYEDYYHKIKSFFPHEFIVGKHRAPWVWLDNRPFLRLFESRANFIERTKGVSKTIPLYEELITLNPNDNQGIRELLSTAYIKTGRVEDLLKLCQNYPKDINAYIVMGRILALFKLGKLDDAKRYIKQAKKYKANIIKELLKTSHKKPKSEMEGYVTVGGEDEAYYYWQDQGTFWASTKGSLEFLRLHCPELVLI